MGPSPFYRLSLLNEAEQDPLLYDTEPTTTLAMQPDDEPPPVDGEEEMGGVPTGPSSAPPPGMSPPVENPEPDTLADYVALADTLAARNKREYMPEEDKPSLIANILTFGMAGLDNYEKRRRYNAEVDKHNAKVNEHSLTQAASLMRAQSAAKFASANLAQRQARFAFDQQKETELSKLRGMEGLLKELRIRTSGAIQGPPNETEAAAADEQGLVYREMIDAPGWWRTFPKRAAAPTTGAGAPTNSGTTYAPPAADSPLGKRLGGQTGAQQGGAVPPAAAGPGGFAGLRQKQAEREAIKQESVAKAKNRLAASKVLPTINAVLNDDTLSLLPSDPGSKTDQGFVGNVMDMARNRKAIIENKPAFVRARQRGDNRAVAFTSLLTTATQLVKIGGDVGAITAEDRRPWNDFIKAIAEGDVSREEARAKLTELRDLVLTATGQNEETPTATAPQTPGTIRASSGRVFTRR